MERIIVNLLMVGSCLFYAWFSVFVLLWIMDNPALTLAGA